MYNPTNFQTPDFVADYMVSLVAKRILIEDASFYEPTKGEGSLVRSLRRAGARNIIAPDNHFDTPIDSRFDFIVTNPPFSSEYAFGFEHLPENDIKGMKLGYYMLNQFMDMSDNVIALMPWFTISDSDVRMRKIIDYGLRDITCLPRKTFQYARIQTCIIELEKGFDKPHYFNYLR